MRETVLSVEKVKVAALRPYANNAKAHPPEQVRRIAASVSAYGFNVPVLVDGDMNIISGHGRVMAAEFLGLEVVPVIRIEHLTDEQVRAFRIADNRAAESAWIDDALAREIAELAEASVDLDGIGFSAEEIARITADPDLEGPVDLLDGPKESPSAEDILRCPRCGMEFCR